MNIQQAARSVKVFEAEPPQEAIDQILAAAQSFDGLSELITALSEYPRPWSARLITLAAIRMARAESATADQLSQMAFDLLGIVGKINDWSASGGCLDLIKCLVEDHGLECRDSSDRLALLDALWQCVTAAHPNARSTTIHTLEWIDDFGGLAGLLGHGGVHELRRRIQKAMPTVAPDVREDLLSAQRLLR